MSDKLQSVVLPSPTICQLVEIVDKLQCRLASCIDKLKYRQTEVLLDIR